MSKTFLVKETVAASASRNATGASSAINSSGSKTIEAYVDITVDASGDFDFSIQTSIDGENWVTQKTDAGISAVGTISLAIARGNDEALGVQARVSWVANSGAFTFSVIIGSYE